MENARLPTGATALELLNNFVTTYAALIGLTSGLSVLVGLAALSQHPPSTALLILAFAAYGLVTSTALSIATNGVARGRRGSMLMLRMFLWASLPASIAALFAGFGIFIAGLLALPCGIPALFFGYLGVKLGGLNVAFLRGMPHARAVEHQFWSQVEARLPSVLPIAP